MEMSASEIKNRRRADDRKMYLDIFRSVKMWELGEGVLKRLFCTGAHITTHF